MQYFPTALIMVHLSFISSSFSTCPKGEGIILINMYFDNYFFSLVKKYYFCVWKFKSIKMEFSENCFVSKILSLTALL